MVLETGVSVPILLTVCSLCTVEILSSAAVFHRLRLLRLLLLRGQRQEWSSSADRLHQEHRVVEPRLRQRRAAPPPALLQLHSQV